MAFHQCEFYDVFSDCHNFWISCHNQDSWMAFSPVWILRCEINSQLCLNFLSQSEQTNGYSPVCILRCIFKTAYMFEFLITIITVECRSGSASVNSLMRIQFSSCFEFLVAIRTVEWFFHRCEWYDVNSICHFVWTSCHNLGRRTTFHQCEFYDVYSNWDYVWISCHSHHSWMTFHQCEFYDAISIRYVV